MSRVLDKKAFWSEILDEVCDMIDSGLYFMLKNKAYIDRVEGGKAVIVCKTDSLKSKIEQRYLRVLSKAFSKALEYAVTVTLVHGPRRIFHKVPNAGETPEYRHKKLFEDHHHIIGIVQNDIIFKQASLPVEEGGWGIFPEKLTDACKDYGVITIQDAIAKIASMPEVDNPRGYFNTFLPMGEFGPKLERSADALGLRAS